ncbi:MAG: hypothetical protein LBK01_04340 [Burkholderiaceae bacterium]|jgi:hypothetical protein|nr:hypothetical protein [Burkholderiaceae bacterium]
MGAFYSPSGNIEAWETKPAGYFTVEEWEEAHPAPKPPPPTSEQLAAQRREEILSRLATIDTESIRPLRAIAEGTVEDFDREKLSALDAEAATLRAELASL